MLECSPVSEGSSQSLIRADTGAAIYAAIEFWAEGSTQVETFERASKLREMMCEHSCHLG